MRIIDFSARAKDDVKYLRGNESNWSLLELRKNVLDLRSFLYVIIYYQYIVYLLLVATCGTASGII